MNEKQANAVIRLRGVRQNNLKNIDLDLPVGRLIVFTGLSGSGKSSLAFDTLFAEGQRRYIETFTPYARQFFDRMDKPQADSIEGIPPAIAVEQRNAVRTTRSTVGTMTEICEYTKLVWPHLATLYCRGCGQPVTQEPPGLIWDTVAAGGRLAPDPQPPATSPPELMVTFSVPLSPKLSLAESLGLVAKQGFQRLLVPAAPAEITPTGGVAPATASGSEWFRIVPVDQAEAILARQGATTLTIVQDRVRRLPANRARFVEACEQAYHLGQGRLAIRWPAAVAPAEGAMPLASRLFSRHWHCAGCDLEYQEPTPALFSFNHPLGACPACKGFGRIISIDYNLALPDRTKTLAGGAVKPWQSGASKECQADLLAFCRQRGVPVQVPFNELAAQWQAWVMEGDPDYGQDKLHEWPHAWYGIKGYFRWLESKTYKMHVRVLLSRYRAYTTCPACRGQRFQPEALLYRVPAADPAAAPAWSLADFYQLPISRAARQAELWAAQAPHPPNDPLHVALEELRARLNYLVEAGLGYLTLDRATRTLSGGETERVNLTACLGSRLVNTLFVLDEPTVGLHHRDTGRLVRILERLRHAGNTVVVVEHEPQVMHAADQLIDLGPGSGQNGGQVVFQGSGRQILKSAASLTGKYLSGRLKIPPSRERPVVASTPRLRLAHAALHNLRDLAVEIPLGRLVCVTGVSGSGKTTLIRDLLLPALNDQLGAGAAGPDAVEEPEPEAEDRASCPGFQVAGWETLGSVVMVDQSALGKTPRSNPAVYTGALEPLRELFAQLPEARQRGLTRGDFSFNSRSGQCERCRGAGFEKIEMQFLSDIFVRCPECNGRRYRAQILEVRMEFPPWPGNAGATGAAAEPVWLSISDLLDTTVDAAVSLLGRLPDSRQARCAIRALQLLREVGLGYLRLGQPLNTLSGGESQRLKLVRHLATHAETPKAGSRSTLFLLDEPTTGLHFDDVRVLLEVFQKMVDAGHSVLVIEHNLEVIQAADWVIDLGPEGGEGGGQIVAQGLPAQVAQCPASHTGQALRGCTQG